MTINDPIAKLRELQENAEALDSTQIKAGVSALNVLTVGDLANVRKEILGSAVGKSKPERLESLEFEYARWAWTGYGKMRQRSVQMPLRDHFRPRFRNQACWEGFHGGWPARTTDRLCRRAARSPLDTWALSLVAGQSLPPQCIG
jgi:hypothetical protein